MRVELGKDMDSVQCLDAEVNRIYQTWKIIQGGEWLGRGFSYSHMVFLLHLINSWLLQTGTSGLYNWVMVETPTAPSLRERGLWKASSSDLQVGTCPLSPCKQVMGKQCRTSLFTQDFSACTDDSIVDRKWLKMPSLNCSWTGSDGRTTQEGRRRSSIGRTRWPNELKGILTKSLGHARVSKRSGTKV